MLFCLANKIDRALKPIHLSIDFDGFRFIEPADLDAVTIEVTLLVHKVFFDALGAHVRQSAIIFLVRHEM